MNKSPFIAISRHRIQTDGEGVTTLCGFYGCPLRCKYCINPRCFGEKTNIKEFTPAELYDKVKIDDLYFRATNGGVTFGGGEPLLYPDFIAEFRSLCGDSWRLCAETSLNVPADSVRIAARVIDHFYVDVKDTDQEIYMAYTGKSNQTVLENLSLLCSLISADRITVRLPLIKGFNSQENREKSIDILKNIGITKFDLFEYKIPEKKTVAN